MTPERREEKRIAKRDYMRLMRDLSPERVRAWERAAYLRRREAHIAARKRRAIARPEQALLTSARYRARVQGVECTITLADIRIPEVCPLLGIRLSRGDGGHHAGSPTLDRIDPRRGYISGNVWVVSMRANLIKNDATPEEISRIAAVLSVFG